MVDGFVADGDADQDPPAIEPYGRSEHAYYPRGNSMDRSDERGSMRPPEPVTDQHWRMNPTVPHDVLRGSDESTQAPRTSTGTNTEVASIGEAFKQRKLAAEHESSFAYTKDAASDRDSKYFEPLLLAHAELYDFADALEIRVLRSLCYEKIHAMLVDYVVTPATICDLIAFVNLRSFRRSRRLPLLDNELISLVAQ